jgi:hypothetical protein
MVNETIINTISKEQIIKNIKLNIEKRTSKINDLCYEVRVLRNENELDLKCIEELENEILFNKLTTV